MSYMFQDVALFDVNISARNVSSVTRMDYMFTNAALFYGDIPGWDVSSVRNMTSMFANMALCGCRTEIVRPELDAPDISGFLRITAPRPLCPVARYKTHID